MVFGDEVQYKRVGACELAQSVASADCSADAYATIPRVPSDTSWWLWYTATGRRSVMTRPDPYGTTRVCLTFMSPDDIGYMEMDVQERVEYLRKRYANAGWQTERILAELDKTDDLYCEDLVQVKAPRYHSGRVVMIGDAAYCATPISGQGTTLSLTGAYILAAELASSPEDHRIAFKEYERKMRPIATKAQNLPPFIPGIVHPETRMGLYILQSVIVLLGAIVTTVMRFPWPRFVTDTVSKLDFGAEPPLPEYADLKRFQ
jgi:2-polyprenyl-6-methoxyphenol hydroxylase-like FAD-dependent oxidoreductase